MILCLAVSQAFAAECPLEKGKKVNKVLREVEDLAEELDEMGGPGQGPTVIVLEKPGDRTVLAPGATPEQPAAMSEEEKTKLEPARPDQGMKKPKAMR